MSHPHNLHELQEGIGQTGKLGEVFCGLGLLIAILGVILFAAGQMGVMSDSYTPDGGDSDAIQVGFLFLFEGLGFIVFGIMIIAAGWGRSHGELT